AGDGLEDGGLAGAVGAQHGDDLAALDLQADAAQCLHRAVAGLDVRELQDSVTHAALPRYASITAGCACTSAGVPSAIIRPMLSASTRSETRDTRFMSCSTISTVTPRWRLMSSIQNAMSSVSSGLRPEEGSSSSRSLGSVASARPSSTTLRTP